MCFYNFVVFWGIWVIQGAKCDQLTQCLNRHGIKRHSVAWFLKQHGPWVIWICHLITGNTILSCTK